MKHANRRMTEVLSVADRSSLKLVIFFAICILQMVTLGSPTSLFALAALSGASALLWRY
jgi:hypothetical protein